MLNNILKWLATAILKIETTDNWNYHKFTCGWCVAWKNQTGTTTSTSSSGGYSYRTIPLTLPITFTTIPFIFGQAIWQNVSFVNFSSKTTSTFTALLLNSDTVSTAKPYEINMVAIGKWK